MSCVRIISNGTPYSTTVEVDGVVLTNVVGVRWEVGMSKPTAMATLDLIDVEVDVVGEVLP